ncbi:signal recognition particle receptor subunit alpha [Candidatus Similichlamydia laticola]|uniref:signal-recognition-particle GTPase n=1 Tax=Candidatus Similichlamydia laticola TaxID=2170265 RepID=A0A369KBW6_9BACT|nr:signal recognition particle receptor subunit alpha [Candidatus Similichlamydia laticola]RDB31408.1 Signal recognition particle, subunit Ffh SRP54 [Candidatus Similichlamydia laticola]
MFSVLKQGWSRLLQGIKQKSFLSDCDSEDICAQMRSLLLEADVHPSVIDHLLSKIKEGAAEAVQRGKWTPTRFTELIYEEVGLLLGKTEESSREYYAEEAENTPYFSPVENKTCVWLFCGLPGQGKTTQIAKLAAFLRQQDVSLSIGLVCADFSRPMAGKQLELLTKELHLTLFLVEPQEDLDSFLQRVLKQSRLQGIHLLLVDSAGCLDTDITAMQELNQICSLLNPEKVFFVVHGGKGQSVLESGLRFHEKVRLTGFIVTMLDGEVKGGSILSMVHRVGVPIVFEGFGERLEDLRLFNPLSMADRILGMGDTFNLKKKLRGPLQGDQIDDLKKRALEGEITFQDYLDQCRALRKCGPLSALLAMVPGFSELHFEENDFVRSEAIICSMKAKERLCLVPFSEKSLHRIASGSGCSVQEVMRLIQNFEAFRSTVRQMGSSFDLDKLKKMMGGLKWH